MSFGSFLDVVTPDTHQLWTNQEELVTAFRAIIEIADVNSREDAIQRVDRAVVEALEAVGLPRGQVQGPRLWPEYVEWKGRKHPDCTLYLSETQLVSATRFNGANDFFSSWVHESLHARQQYQNAFHEYRNWSGYEEGLVAALTRRVLAAGGIVNVPFSYQYFVTAYEILADVVEVEISELLRALWEHPTGQVRRNFAAGVNRLRERNGMPTIDRLQLAGDIVFRSDRARDVPDHQSMVMLIQRTLR